MIKAKTVVPDQFWILQQNESKIGNIEAINGQYEVTVNGKSLKVDSIKSFADDFDVDFIDVVQVRNNEIPWSVHGYPTSSHAYNAVFDVKEQLPLWTQEPRSRSWYAAGWYRVKQHRDWKVIFCPKLIFLNRYRYEGPFKSVEEANFL